MTVVHPQTRGLTIGSLFSGYGGLTLATEAVFGGRVAWHCEVEPAPSKILAERWPDVPNLGDVTEVDWSQVEPVDVIDGGSPCQDVSSAGRRAGMRAGTRSGLWASMCDAIETVRPRFVVWENVRGVLSAGADSAVESCPGCVGDGSGAHLRALGRVLGDLAELGYDARWCGLHASDVGAPHGRFRIFVLAADAASTRRQGRTGQRIQSVESGSGRAAVADTEYGRDTERSRAAGRLIGERPPVRREPGHDRGVAADAERGGRAGRSPDARREPLEREIATGDRAGDRAPSDSGRGGLARLEAEHGTESALRLTDAERSRIQRGATADTCRLEVGPEPLGEPGSGDQAVAGHPVQWGRYEPAIRRWEHALGRVAPAPTEPNTRGGQRLSPRFVEWMMGLPDGWVCDVPGISRNDKLKALGNGVVSQQAEAALRLLLSIDASERAA